MEQVLQRQLGIIDSPNNPATKERVFVDEVALEQITSLKPGAQQLEAMRNRFNAKIEKNQSAQVNNIGTENIAKPDLGSFNFDSDINIAVLGAGLTEVDDSIEKNPNAKYNKLGELLNVRGEIIPTEYLHTIEELAISKEMDIKRSIVAQKKRDFDSGFEVKENFAESKAGEIQADVITEAMQIVLDKVALNKSSLSKKLIFDNALRGSQFSNLEKSILTWEINSLNIKPEQIIADLNTQYRGFTKQNGRNDLTLDQYEIMLESINKSLLPPDRILELHNLFTKRQLLTEAKNTIKELSNVKFSNLNKTQIQNIEDLQIQFPKANLLKDYPKLFFDLQDYKIKGIISPINRSTEVLESNSINPFDKDQIESINTHFTFALNNLSTVLGDIYRLPPNADFDKPNAINKQFLKFKSSPEFTKLKQLESVLNIKLENKDLALTQSEIDQLLATQEKTQEMLYQEFDEKFLRKQISKEANNHFKAVPIIPRYIPNAAELQLEQDKKIEAKFNLKASAAKENKEKLLFQKSQERIRQDIIKRGLEGFTALLYTVVKDVASQPDPTEAKINLAIENAKTVIEETPYYKYMVKSLINNNLGGEEDAKSALDQTAEVWKDSKDYIKAVNYKSLMHKFEQDFSGELRANVQNITNEINDTQTPSVEQNVKLNSSKFSTIKNILNTKIPFTPDIARIFVRK
jgi:hypothetical protein